MRKIDQLARDHFGGDVRQTLEHLLYQKGTHALDAYVDELTSEEAGFVMGLLEKDAVAYYGSEENFRRELKKNRLLVELGLEESDVRDGKNPHAPTLFLRLILLSGFLFLTPFVTRLEDILGLNAALLIAVITGLLAVLTVMALIPWMKFRKAKELVLWADVHLPRQQEDPAS